MKNPKYTYLLAFVVALVAAFAARTLYYYRGQYHAPEVPQSTPRHIGSLSDEYDAVAEVSGEDITVLIDVAHQNGFDQDDLTVFTGRLASNGGRVEFVSSPDALADRLRDADALVVIAPGDAFVTEELLDIQAFIDKGGRLILVGDPTLQGDPRALNSLAGSFGVIYQDDYVYSLSNNDGNFRNVIFTDFAKGSSLTRGLKEVVFQTAYSLRAPEDTGLIFGDEEVYSSRSEQPGGVVVAALTGEGQVLALPDMTFLTSPHNAFADNDILVDNIVTFALSGVRSFSLTDFPYFFDAATQIVYAEPVTLNNTFADAVALRTELDSSGIPAALAEEFDEEHAFIYLALYEQADRDILNLLKDAGVQLSDEPLSEGEEEDVPPSEGSIIIEGVARLEKGGAVLLHLTQAGGDGNGDEEEPADGPYRLVILAAGEEELSNGIDRLVSGQLSDCLVTPQTAVCRMGEVGEEEGAPPEMGPGGVLGEILVVSDDQGLATDGQTSAEAITGALGALGQSVTVVGIKEDGTPGIEELVAYDMVFWSVGDYCCDAPNEEGVSLLKEYLNAGGRLFIDGLFIATDWSADVFLSDYLGAEFRGFAAQSDIAPAEDAHPLSAGFTEPIPFVGQKTDAPQPDVIGALSGVDVVFVRGPESEEAGAPALIAYDKEGRRVAYAAFPLHLLPEDELVLLIGNAIGWLAP